MPNAKQQLRSPKLWLSDTWAFEFLALVLSILALIAIVILLRIYYGRPQFSFHGVTLNAVIAVLAACVRIGFAIPVSEGLAQWKWLWFASKTRPLGDFDTLDDASRGSRGSLLLLWETKSRSVAHTASLKYLLICQSTLPAIAAWVVLLSVATEPFIQQIVSFEDKVMCRPDSGVQIPYAQSWSGATESTGDPNPGFSNTDGRLRIRYLIPY